MLIYGSNEITLEMTHYYRICFTTTPFL